MEHATLVAPLISFNWTLLMVFITFFVLYLIVKRLFFDKIHNFIQAREQKVKDQFDNAEAVENLAKGHLAEYEAKLDGVEFERRGVLKDAKTLAEQRAEQIVKEAKEHAERITRQAEANIEREREQFAIGMRDQVAMLAVYMAEKIIEKQLDEKEQMVLIDEIISKSEEKQWTH